MLPVNYHMHSRYCDGQGEIEDYVQDAIRRGMTSIGTSSHAPVPFPNTYTVRPEMLAAYVAEIQRLQVAYSGQIEFGMALEVDVIPGLQEHFMTNVVPYNFDYFIGSVHHIGIDPTNGDPWEFDAGADNFAAGWHDIYNENIRAMVAEFYGRERLVPGYIPGIAIVGHMDRIKRFNYNNRYFGEQDQWYRDEVEATLQSYATSDIIVELNTAGWRTPTADAFPSDWIVQRCHELGIRMNINTDAHSPIYLQSDHDRAIARLQTAGYREIWVRRNGQWVGELLPA